MTGAAATIVNDLLRNSSNPVCMVRQFSGRKVVLLVLVQNLASGRVHKVDLKAHVTSNRHAAAVVICCLVAGIASDSKAFGWTAVEKRSHATDTERFNQPRRNQRNNLAGPIVRDHATKALVLDTGPTHYKILPAARSKGVAANRQQ
jgi:hypothetical protein